MKRDATLRQLTTLPDPSNNFEMQSGNIFTK